MSEYENGQQTEQDKPQEVVPASSLGMMLRAEIDTQIATAKQYPRSLTGFKKLAMQMATLDEETAASCFYSLPRGGKPIEGPSVRLAEIVGSAWGNVRYGARVVADDGKIITAQGVCHDLETNVSSTIEVRRRVTDRKGKRFSDDMVVVTGNAACSIALRNAIFKVVPMAYTKTIYQAARQAAIGDIKTLAHKRAEAVAYFQKMGVPQDRIFAAVGVASIEDIGLDQLATLKGLATAVRDGETSIDEAFPAAAKPAGGLAAALKDRLTGNGTNATNGHAKPADATPPEPTNDESVPTNHAPAAPPDPDILADEIRQDIAAAGTVKKLEDVGRRMRKSEDILGEQLYALCLDAWQARRADIEGATANK